MSVPNLADLVVPASPDSVLATELAIATQLGLPVTAWQPLGIARTTYYVNANVASNYSQTVALVAQGGYLSYAAQMKDVKGNDITTWMDLVGTEVYGVDRIAATYASTDSTGFSVTNSAATPQGPFAPGALHFENPITGKTYHNTATVTIAGSTSTGVALTADEVGSASTSGVSTVTSIVAPTLPSCTCTNSKSLVGSDQESNAAYEQRCEASLGALSPNGPSQAYFFVATSILDPAQKFYNPNLSQPITKVKTITAPAAVSVYIANDAGAPSGGDVTIVNAAIQAWCVPLGTTATVAGASNLGVNITYTAYAPAAASSTTAEIETDISDALATYFKTLPIGGVTDAAPNVVPWSGLLAVIKTANKDVTSVTLTAPSGDTTLTATQVAVIGALTPTVVRT